MNNEKEIKELQKTEICGNSYKKELKKLKIAKLIYYILSLFCIIVLSLSLYIDKNKINKEEINQDGFGIINLTQYDMNVLSYKEAGNFHEYYEKVVKRIKEFDFRDDDHKTALEKYISGYKDRFESMKNLIFPHAEIPMYYGSIFPVLYAGFCQTFDEIELYTYKKLLLLTDEFSTKEAEKIFEDN